MKIGFDVSQTCVERAGCGWFAHSLATELASLCHETNDELILYHHFDKWINEDASQGTDASEYGALAPMQKMAPKEAAKLWSKINESAEILPGQPDVVHANNFCAPVIKGSKLVYTIYDVSFWACPEFTTEANRLHCQDGILEGMKNAAAFVFISENTRQEFEDTFPGWLKVNNKPHIVIPLGVREYSETLMRAGQSTHWLTVGSLEPRKNHHAILDAMDLYWEKSERKLPLLIAGGAGWKSEALKSRILEMESQGKVQSLGYVPDSELPQLYATATGFLFASWHEGFGLPILEAMSLGCPIITSDRASLPEVGGDAPIYFDPSKPSQITDAMLRIELDADLQNSMSTASLKRAQLFTWKQAAIKLISFYKEITKYE